MRIILVAVAALCLSAAALGQTTPSPTPTRPPEGPHITGPGITELPTLRSLKPKITLQKALKLAESYMKREKIKTSSHYLSEARIILFDGRLDARALRWLFVWASNSGLPVLNIQVTVSMSGKAVKLPSPLDQTH